MSPRRFSYAIWPAVFFSAAMLAAALMERAIGKNLDNTFRQLIFLSPNPRPSPDADKWFWTAVACFVFGLAASWRAFRCIRRARPVQQGASPNGRPAEQFGDSGASGGAAIGELNVRREAS